MEISNLKYVFIIALLFGEIICHPVKNTQNTKGAKVATASITGGFETHGTSLISVPINEIACPEGHLRVRLKSGRVRCLQKITGLG